MENQLTILEFLKAYLNFAGFALITALFFLWGFNLISKKKVFSARSYFGLSLIIFGLLLLIWKIPYVLSTPS